MKKMTIVLFTISFLISCGGKGSFVLQESIGKDNRVLVVAKSSHWLGEVGDELKKFMNEKMVGLPQPESHLTLSHVASNGFSKIMKRSRNILILEENDTEKFTVTKNKYAQSQTLIYISGKDKESLIKQLKKYNKKIIKTFKDSDIKTIQKRFAKNRLDDSKYKTLQNLKVSLTIPEVFKTVDDTGEFLWLRQHLKSGVTKGTNSNNLLVYTLPLTDEHLVLESIAAMRDSIGKRYIPGSNEGMYMITEKAYTPLTIKTKINTKNAFETRGKWEVKNDFMAGPFVNYTILDKENNRLLVVEGFTYAPAENKREFLFELEAIAKSIQIE